MWFNKLRDHWIVIKTINSNMYHYYSSLGKVDRYAEPTSRSYFFPLLEMCSYLPVKLNLQLAQLIYPNATSPVGGTEPNNNKSTQCKRDQKPGISSLTRQSLHLYHTAKYCKKDKWKHDVVSREAIEANPRSWAHAHADLERCKTLGNSPNV